ncbi:DUF2752 domain-containing protein [Robertkochia marina]|uniref:DUF2752 domain-containing protein n=2 Tax=Robertkochia marina TaxID=1227945 RepID=A0A4S3LZH9_9FLAO|nr:DUF2752 domain-containing protein [Robertkochia marina]TRZ45691.1 DUF2752 domain-containing protein [Robertkochia marina]
MLPCLTKTLFGVECFGCGLQRAAVLLFRGEFTAAFQMYPAIYTLILLFALIFTRNLIRIPHYSKILYILVAINLALIVGNYFLK